MEHELAQLRLEQAQLQLEQANNEFDSFPISDQTRPASLDAMTEVRIYDGKRSWADIDEASIISTELIVDMNSTLHDVYQCPNSDSHVVPTNIFKGPRNLGELSPSATSTTTPSQ